MRNKFQEHITANLPFLKGKKLLVAISGGIDSVVLTHLLYDLDFDISLAHCNFQLRDKESDLDAYFVKKLAEKIGKPYFETSFQTTEYAEENNLSIQMAARELRYNWFEEIRKENKLDFVLTAHQKEDVLETFLINFTRGTGLDGLTGIPVKNGSIVRPLLPFSREEIEKYAQENNINWREDQSNASTKYARNKIRHEVIPVLKSLNPSLLKSLDKTLENLNESKQIIDDKIAEIKSEVTREESDTLILNISKLKKTSNPKAYLFELLKPYGFTQWSDLSDLLNAQTGKQILSNSHRIIKNRDELLLTKINKKEQKVYYVHEDTSVLKIDDFELILTTSAEKNKILSSQNEFIVDKNMLKFPLTVRKWEKGDYFYPLGMQGKKKLSKYFKDEKMSILEKEKTWLLCTALNEIVWILGKRPDNRFKITNNTTDTIKISLNK